MRKWVARVVWVAALAGTGLVAWHYLFPNPEQVIRKRVKEVGKLASCTPPTGPLAKALNPQKLASLFSADVVVVIDIPGHSVETWTGRDTLAEMALRVRNILTEMRVEFPDVEVSISPGKQEAIVNVTAKIDYSGQRTPEVQELRLLFEKTGGDWLIKRVETVRTLLQKQGVFDPVTREI